MRNRLFAAHKINFILYDNILILKGGDTLSDLALIRKFGFVENTINPVYFLSNYLIDIFLLDFANILIFKMKPDA